MCLLTRMYVQSVQKRSISFFFSQTTRLASSVIYCPHYSIHRQLVTRPRPKAGGRVLNSARFVCLFAFYSMSQMATLETLAGWSEVGNLETLIGSRALYSDHVLLLLRSLFSVELMANCTEFWFWLARSVRSTSR